MNFLTALFESIKAIFVFANKVAPSEKIQEANAERKKLRLELKEMDKILEESRLYLSVHPRITVDVYVSLKFDLLDEEDREEIRTALHEMFPKRDNRGLKLKKDI